MNTFDGCRHIVVKIGGSCLKNRADYKKTAQSLVRFQEDTGAHLAVVISAASGVTDRLIAQARRDFPGDLWAQAASVAQGEIYSATDLVTALVQMNVACRLGSASRIGLAGWGGDDPFNGYLFGVDVDKLMALALETAFTVLPGYFALDSEGRRVLLGRNSTDLIAVAVAHALNAPCCFCKESGSLYAIDPGLVEEAPRRLSRLSYDQAYEFAASGYEFLKPECLQLAKQGNVPLHFMPNSTADNAWQTTAVIGNEPLAGESGATAVIGVCQEAHCNGIPCGCVTITQWGAVGLNGRVRELAEGCAPQAFIRENGHQARIFLAPSEIPALVATLAEGLGLLGPVELR